jgi:hypothetical protein
MVLAGEERELLKSGNQNTARRSHNSSEEHCAVTSAARFVRPLPCRVGS